MKAVDGSEQTGLGADGVESAVDRRLEGLTVRFSGDRDRSRVCVWSAGGVSGGDDGDRVADDGGDILSRFRRRVLIDDLVFDCDVTSPPFNAAVAVLAERNFLIGGAAADRGAAVRTLSPSAMTSPDSNMSSPPSMPGICVSDVVDECNG